MSDGPPLPPQLTVRHQQLLRLLAEGITDSEIARRMHLSERQVRREVASLLHTFGCRNRFQLGAATSFTLTPRTKGSPCPMCPAHEGSFV
ncbi:MAG TPA: helix-turn-helix transcriptional regulator [Candidatus Stackebrandtia excrementipullorum]|nr:helix-turn-helix transcriptional regulator [Candidatus Stackebrandtia excrementipullorum]